MIKMILCFFLVTVSSARAAVPGGQSAECHAPDSAMIRVYFDLWLVGHPMGGLLSYEAILDVDGHKSIAHVSMDPVSLNGSTSDLSRIDYSLVVGDLFTTSALNVDVTTQLSHRSQALGPVAAGSWITETVICRWVAYH